MNAPLNEGWNLPPGWEWSTIGCITNNHDNERIPVKAVDRAAMQGPYPYYGASGVIDWVDDYLFNGEYLLITEDGNLLTGSSSVAFLAKGKFWVNNHAHAVQTLGKLPLGYLKAYLNYVNLAGYVTGTTRPKLTQTALNRIPIPLPPLPEQRRIVAEIEKQLTRLDASVAALERVRANLKRFRASVLKTACKGELVKSEADLAQSEDRQYESANVLLGSILTRRQMRWESKHEGRRKYKEPIVPDISQLPVLAKGWAWASMAHIADIQGGFQKQPKRIPKENSFPYLRVANVQRGKLTLDEVYAAELFAGELEKLRLVRGDLLIVEGNGSQSQIGRMAIWNDEIADCVHQNHIIRARPHEGIIPAFVECYWNSPEGSARVHSIASSTSGLYTLSVSKVSQLPVPIPPIAEQRRIVAEVERRLSVIQQIEEAVDTSLKRAERLRQSVLKQAFCGQLVPQDPGDEPAFALLERILAERAEAQVAAEASNKRGRRTRRKARAVS